MDIDAELARFKPSPALREWVGGTIQTFLDQAARDKEIIRQRDLKIQALALELAHHRRMRFGKKSEALSAEQRDLFEETWESDLGEIQAEVEVLVTPSEPRASRSRAGRQPLPEHLPRIEHRHEPESCTCGKCGSALVLIGEDVTEQLDVEPARFFVHRHIRPQLACRPCESVVAAEVPPAIIDGGMASPGLLAWIMTSKYVDHIPLYRLERIAARDNVILSRSTQAEYVGKVGVSVQPLVDRLVAHLLQGSALLADETPVQQLDPGAGKTKRGYLWAYRSNDLEGGPPIVVFDYQPSRAGVHARNFLEGWEGHLMVDDYVGYKAGLGDKVKELGCLAHVRRKFYELFVANKSPLAQQALQRIAQLYEIESRGKTMQAQERLELRQREAKPILTDFLAWIEETLHVVAKGSGAHKALLHASRRSEALARYVESGILPIDNNLVESAIRPIALGRKNWLHVGSERAGRRAANIQSLLETAKLNGLDPYAWLKDTLEKLPVWPNSRIDELLPLRAKPA